MPSGKHFQRGILITFKHTRTSGLGEDEKLRMSSARGDTKLPWPMETFYLPRRYLFSHLRCWKNNGLNFLWQKIYQPKLSITLIFYNILYGLNFLWQNISKTASLSFFIISSVTIFLCLLISYAKDLIIFLMCISSIFHKTYLIKRIHSSHRFKLLSFWGLLTLYITCCPPKDFFFFLETFQ